MLSLILRIIYKMIGKLARPNKLHCWALHSRCLFIIEIFWSKIKTTNLNLNHQNAEIHTWPNSSNENPIKQKEKLGTNFRNFLHDWAKTKICELECVVKRTIKHHFPDSFSQHYILPLFSSLLGFLYEI